MSNKRNLQSLRSFYICILIFNMVSNSIFHLNNNGFNIKLFKNFTIRSVILLDLNILLFLIIVIAFEKKINIDEEANTQLNTRIRPLYLVNIFFIAYILVCIFLLKDIDVILSSFIMEIIYIGIIILSKKIITLELTNRQLQWQKACGYIDEDCEESSFLWRFKLWWSPHVNVPFKNRWKGSSRLLYDLALVYGIIISKGNLFSLILLILLLPDVISWLEGLLGLQTSLTGICTGITEHHSKNSHVLYHKVYVTDYKNKREITFYVDGPLFIHENSHMTVVHGTFSKRVLYVEGLNLDIR
ncbi:hypothetical protein [Clostridium botulinum]|uniref:Uncharacterized protein n=1 Tax=Clostridium botulinum (strain Langeland / NCTC 10281 / Type F) TaxID=441772 RepID=A7GFC2_CLOBL|nr:hypothetical protein [Clostridium botulinum]ABS40838.1 hypothetical protein CLI_2232 [Clostridium botulinum F str. Langeland]ADF99883.1 hypothetical protein CBF_2217 [Clostridium botulinum F str. 230613]KKM42542.1 hypothetical protein VT72_02565 [Clostridium botulinum]MBY6792972.1 hypothetical protein [Clostridium botulinum]MBY6937181.1 hypothetical protein [Clostridium botulinum]